MIRFAIKNLCRRPIRTALTAGGVAAAVCVLASLLAFGEGYRKSLDIELKRMGIQMMLVPPGCPYDAAARVLKGKALDVSLPESALAAVRLDSAVAQAAPLLMAAIPRPSEGRTDMWVGIDETLLPLKPWWKFAGKSGWFTNPSSVIMGNEAAVTEMRRAGDSLYSPETKREFHISGILERSGTSDDSMFFVPIQTAQEMFHQEGRITAVGIRLKDPSQAATAAVRFQQIPGAQVVTMGEMMGTFTTLVDSVRTLMVGIAGLALVVSGLTVFNTMLAMVMERTRELGVMRAAGAGRGHLLKLLFTESLLLTGFGSGLGLLIAVLFSSTAEHFARMAVPLAPDGRLMDLSPAIALQCAGAGILVGAVAGIYPACRAAALQPIAAMRESAQ